MSDQRNTKMVTVMITPELFLRIKEVAKTEDKAISELLREVFTVAFPKEEGEITP